MHCTTEQYKNKNLLAAKVWCLGKGTNFHLLESL